MRYLFSLLLLTLTLSFPQSLWAIGSEFTLSGSDLIVDVNYKWIGGREGGYYPLRVRVRNIGKPRTISLEFQPNSNQPVPRVTRKISIEQNATVNTTLPIPLVDNGYSGRFRVYENGLAVKNLDRVVSLSDASGMGERGPCLLMVSPKLVDGTKYNEAVGNMIASAHSHSHYSYYGGSVELTQHVTPAELPSNWISYTSLDLLAIPLKSLAGDIKPDVREAILNWVQSGGTLIVYDIGDPPAESGQLEEQLDFAGRGFVGKEWNSASTQQYKQLRLVDPTDSSTTKLEDLSTGAVWPIQKQTFAIRDFGLGKVAAFPDNPFPGTASHWHWLIESMGGNNLEWQNRTGMVARQANSSFLYFLIPSVGGVPVISFLLLITVFTVVIGPLNYGYFMRKKRLSMLLLTVPVLALGSSVLLLGYSTVAHGFSTKSRVRSLTIIDQPKNHALNISRVAYYAGMAPSSGLKFDPSTAVFPIWATPGAFETGRVDWSDTQHFSSGWLRSRTRTQFLTVGQTEQRGRLEIQNESSESPTLSNGLEWELGMLFIVDKNGKEWFAHNVEPGAVVKLIASSPEDRSALRELLSDNDLVLPEGVTETQANRVVGAQRGGMHRRNDESYANHYSRSLQERVIRAPYDARQMEKILQPGSYFATVNDNPDLDIGMQGTSIQASLHVLVGYF